MTSGSGGSCDREEAASLDDVRIQLGDIVRVSGVEWEPLRIAGLGSDSDPVPSASVSIERARVVASSWDLDRGRWFIVVAEIRGNAIYLETPESNVELVEGCVSSRVH